jgi:hypothetical protein
MHENVSKSPDRGKKLANKVVPTAGSETPPLESNGSDSKLRVVWCDSRLRDGWSPKLIRGCKGIRITEATSLVK